MRSSTAEVFVSPAGFSLRGIPSLTRLRAVAAVGTPRLPAEEVAWRVALCTAELSMDEGAEVRLSLHKHVHLLCPHCYALVARESMRRLDVPRARIGATCGACSRTSLANQLVFVVSESQVWPLRTSVQGVA